jgi:hypothetical protein
MDSERFSVELIKLREEMSKSRHSNNDHIVSVINEIRVDQATHKETVDALTKTVAPLIDAVAEIKSVATELKFMASTRMEQIEKDVAENKSQAKEAKVLAYENQRKVDGLEREVSTLISETKAQGISILKHNNYLQMGFGAFVIGQVIWNIYKHLNG